MLQEYDFLVDFLFTVKKLGNDKATQTFASKKTLV